MFVYNKRMYRYIDPRTIAYPVANIIWRDILNLNSTSIDPFVIVITIQKIAKQ